MDDTRPATAWALALLRAPGVGPVTYRLLVERLGSARSALDWLRARGGPCPEWRGVDADLAWLERPGHHLLTLADPGYPPALREIPDPPPLLFVAGDPQTLTRRQIAVVGSRNPTPGGRELAVTLARGLAGAGVTVTSGLALGIDAAAHRGALAAGGRSVAVAGTGPDRVYPSAHRGLAGEVAAAGAMVSEFPTGTPPLRHHFPRRNRIISGLSLGVVVVEAALRSGSRITARHAADQGREVFAVPGAVGNPLARGCHALLRDGAKLVESVADILEEIDPAGRRDAEAPRNDTPERCDGVERRVLAAMGHAPVAVDTLVERSGLTADAVSAILLTLELRGLAAPVPGGRYVRAATGSGER